MAEKRMFSNLILNNDEFIEMPLEAQMLYIRLNMAADDRGICDGPRTVMRACGACNDSMKLLIAKKFVLIPSCKPSVVVIKHWWVNNNLRKERFKETKHTDVLHELYYDGNKSYSQNPNDGHIACASNGQIRWPTEVQALSANTYSPDLPPTDTQRVPTGYPTDTQRVPQYSIGKYSIVESRLEEDSKEKDSKNNNTLFSGIAGNRGVGEEPRVPPSCLTGEERERRIDFFSERLKIFDDLGYDPSCWFSLAESEGIRRDEILERRRTETKA